MKNMIKFKNNVLYSMAICLSDEQEKQWKHDRHVYNRIFNAVLDYHQAFNEFPVSYAINKIAGKELVAIANESSPVVTKQAFDDAMIALNKSGVVRRKSIVSPIVRYSNKTGDVKLSPEVSLHIPNYGAINVEWVDCKRTNPSIISIAYKGEMLLEYWNKVQ